MVRDVVVLLGRAITDVDIAVERGASLTIHYRGSKQYAQLRAIASGVTVGVAGIQPGSEHTLVLPAGSTVVQRFDDNGILEETIVVLAAGEEQFIEFSDRQ